MPACSRTPESELHDLHARLWVCLAALFPPLKTSPELPTSPALMTNAIHLLRLMRVALHSHCREKSEMLDQELSILRQHLQCVREELPRLELALLCERQRLEKELERLRNASDWSRSSRQTL